jgi:hypothetical protein
MEAGAADLLEGGWMTGESCLSWRGGGGWLVVEGAGSCLEANAPPADDTTRNTHTHKRAGAQAGAAREQHRALLAALRPEAVALVDAFGWEDYALNSGECSWTVRSVCCGLDCVLMPATILPTPAHAPCLDVRVCVLPGHPPTCTPSCPYCTRSAGACRW